MGHQVNFYMTPRDVAALEQALHAAVPIVVLHSRSGNERPRVVESLSHDENGQQWLFFYLARPKDLAEIATTFVSTQAYWSIDTTTAPVVEFHLSFFNGKLLRRGRAYYVDSYFGSDQARISKSEEFTKWARKILAVVRRNLVKQDGNYIGPDAKNLLGMKEGALILE
jgi:hypothetical protein